MKIRGIFNSLWNSEVSVFVVIYNNILNPVKLRGFHYKCKKNFSREFFGLQKEVAALFVHGIVPIKTSCPPAGRGLHASVACIFQHLNSLFCFVFFLTNRTAAAIFFKQG